MLVVQAVAGSNPVVHPSAKCLQIGQFAFGRSFRTGPDFAIENGQVNSLLDTHVRLAGSLSIALDDLLAGVTWKPGSVELEYESSYVVEM